MAENKLKETEAKMNAEAEKDAKTRAEESKKLSLAA
jgi:hypothetical protein